MLRDDALSQFVEIAEKLDRAHSVLEDGHSDFVKDVLQIDIRSGLKV